MKLRLSLLNFASSLAVNKLAKTPQARVLDTRPPIYNHGRMVHKTAVAAQFEYRSPKLTAPTRARTRSNRRQADSQRKLLFRRMDSIPRCGARGSSFQFPASSIQKRSVTPCRSNRRVTHSKQTMDAPAKCHTFRRCLVRIPDALAGELSGQNKTGGKRQRRPPPGVGGVCCRTPSRNFGVPAPGCLSKPAFSRCHV